MNRIFIAILLFSTFCCVTSCRHGGNTYRNGEEWRERNAFIMRCTIFDNGSWKTEVVACVSPTGSRIPINSSMDSGPDQWRCQMNDRGMVTLVQGANPSAGCDGHSPGSKWQEKSFELECRPGGIRRLVACVTEDGQRIPVNGSKEVNGFTLACRQFANGTVVFHGAKSVKANAKAPGAAATVLRCIDERGISRNIGEFWIENHRFNKTCRETGAVEVVNCISKDGYSIPLNGQLIRDGIKYSCSATPEGTIRFAAGPVEQKL
jgi:hypothetical protein